MWRGGDKQRQPLLFTYLWEPSWPHALCRRRLDAKPQLQACSLPNTAGTNAGGASARRQRARSRRRRRKGRRSVV